MVDRNEHMHPLVVVPLLEVPSAEDTATDGLITHHFDTPPSAAGHCGKHHFDSPPSGAGQCGKRGLFWAIAGHTPG